MGRGLLLREGDTVWRVKNAERLAFLVDGAAYYRALAAALTQARRSVLIAAWEIDDHASLDPLGQNPERPPRLGDAFRACLSARPSLNVHVLAWDFAMIYAVERGLQPLFRLRFSTGRRLHLELDAHHPVGASHHQKLVVLDDRVAFLGGLDLTQHRWDRPAHTADEPGRVDDDENPYPPFHDVQVAVQGDAAAAVAELFRERWAIATGDRLDQDDSDGDPPWPDGLEPDVENVEVALARTQPRHEGREEVREVERLYLDAIASARRSIYVENQYLTSARVVGALCERLGDRDGPEVVLVLPRRCPGWLEQRTVGLLRRRRLQQLREADRGGRLRVVFPEVPGVDDGVFVHAKVMVVDNTLARVGSANLSNRSMGFDTELDLALASDGDARVARVISGFRNRLLAEHLESDPETVAQVVEGSGGSLAAALDRLSSASESGRTLRPLDEPPLESGWEEALEIGQDLADPESPERPERLLTSFLARDLPRAARTPWLKAAAVAALLAILAGVWRFTPLTDWLTADRLARAITAIQAAPLTPVGIIAFYVVASVLFVPVTLLIVATSLVFEPLEALAFALAGALSASVATFGLGRLLGRSFVQKAAGRRLNEVSRRIARRGLLAVAALRLVPIAPFTLVNLVAGASHVGLRDFTLGTLLGLAPGVLGIVLLEASLEHLIREPGLGTLLSVVAIVGILVVAFALLRRLTAKPKT
ncbi:MAG: VTT domain-containing protein [Acidobacteria bacterium]|nr:VTT domain-containing protein [Acidobacteriota bacterium]